MRHAVVELALAVTAAAGSVASWMMAQSTVTVPPIADGEPTTQSVAYYPPLVVLALALGTIAGVLTVVGIARLKRSRSGAARSELT